MIENKDVWAREIAAQCWCDKETAGEAFHIPLAMAVAKRIAFAYDEGRKAERERCLSIIERWRPMTKQSWVTVSDEIGGQDGK